jgi:hypothetical protein
LHMLSLHVFLALKQSMISTWELTFRKRFPMDWFSSPLNWTR